MLVNFNTDDIIAFAKQKIAYFHDNNISTNDIRLVVHILLTFTEKIKRDNPNEEINFEALFKAFHQAMTDLYKQNPQETPKSICDYINALTTSDSRPIIKAFTHRAKSLMFDTTKAGRKLHDKEELTAICEGSIRFPTGETGSKKNPKPVKTVLTLSFAEMEEWKSLLPANKKITPFALEILMHGITLKAAGNDWVSSTIFFTQMNGGKETIPTADMRHALYEALSVLACTRIKIDATQEHKAGLNTKDFYEGALLASSVRGREIITLNGSICTDAIHLLEQSPLIEYGLAKGQISSHIPVGMLYTPGVNSTQENIVIKGYLTRAFADMVNPHNPIQPIISYDTLYNYLGVEGSNKQVIRNKKAKIRATVRAILSAWLEGGFTKGFQELTADNKRAKERVPVAKVKIDLLTLKEFKKKLESENNMLDK